MGVLRGCKQWLNVVRYGRGSVCLICPSSEEEGEEVGLLVQGVFYSHVYYFTKQDAFSTIGISSQVCPFKRRPARFLLTPPHCLKKKATPAFLH
jgi:hypothetical protein